MKYVRTVIWETTTIILYFNIIRAPVKLTWVVRCLVAQNVFVPHKNCKYRW